MSKETKETYNIPNVYISDLERLVQKIRGIVGTEDTEISFEFVIASLFPTSWGKIREQLKHQYTLGYIAGTKESYSSEVIEEDADCFCE